jgi:hypothetical protein
MSAETDFYNLYEISNESESKTVIVKAIRPDFRNYDQNQENDAWRSLDHNRESEIKAYCSGNGYSNYTFIAEWMYYPVGDVFYGDATGIEVPIWLSIHKDGKPYFMFGSCATEEEFWREMEQDFEDGDCWIYPELNKPAVRKNAIYIQQKT